jgi:predicted amidohydrolase
MGELEYNRKLLHSLITEAAGRGAKIVVLPECAVHGYMDPGRERVWVTKDNAAEGCPAVEPVAEPVPGESTRYFGSLAKKLGIYLALPLVEKSGERFYNAQVLLDPQGAVAAHHRKTNLWAPGDGTWATEAEEQPRVVDSPYGRLGLMICYEVHVLPEKLAAAKADIVLYSVGWFGPNTEGWYKDIFPRRYVVPNGFHVVVSNWSADVGAPGWPGHGYSCVIDRTGAVLAMAKETRGSELVIADLPCGE